MSAMRGAWLGLLVALFAGGCGLVDDELYQQRLDELTDDDGDGFTEDDGDCNDNDPDVYPDAVESCNGIDDDCDGLADEDAVGPTWYLDGDGDGHGSADNSVQSCAQPEGFVDASDDCDDARADVYPGAAELCDEVDQDCDGEVDEGAEGTQIWYPDADQDGFGTDIDDNLVFESCRSPGTGWVTVVGDCDDADPAVSPDAPERCNDVDDNCDGDVDEAPTIDPPTWYYDGDGDGYGTDADVLSQCAPPKGYREVAGDCDDGRADVYPGADEYCNGRDDDCDDAVDEAPTVGDGTWYHDGDGDGYGDDADTLVTCTPPDAYVLDAGDCDDVDPAVNPGAEEVCNDGIDNNCDATAADPGIGADCHWDAELELMDQIVIEGVYEDESFGRGMAFGDLDGDGVTEVLVGAPYAYDAESDTHPGAIFSFEAPITAGGTWEDADWAIQGEADVSQLGSKLAVADVDGDGVDDLVSGAWYLDVGTLNSAGRAYITYGPLTGGGSITDLADWTLSGVTDEGQLGERIHTVGDLDGDGVTDVIVGSDGAYLASYGGVGLLYLLTDAGSGSADIDTVAAAVFTPDEAETMGREYTGVDINADGVDDLLLGAVGSDRSGERDAGSVYVFYGGDLSGEVNTDDYDLWWYGESAADGAGATVDVAGDVNNDGVDDIIIGAPYYDGRGAAYIVWGGVGVTGGPLADADITFRGDRDAITSNSRYLGWMARGMGDLNGDGEDDVLLGESGGPPNDRYVFYGPFDSPTVISDLDADVLLYVDDEDEDGSMALSPGDITGDGVPDIALGNYSHTAGFDYWAGTIYIVPGMGL